MTRRILSDLRLAIRVDAAPRNPRRRSRIKSLAKVVSAIISWSVVTDGPARPAAPSNLFSSIAGGGKDSKRSSNSPAVAQGVRRRRKCSMMTSEKLSPGCLNCFSRSWASVRNTDRRCGHACSLHAILSLFQDTLRWAGATKLLLSLCGTSHFHPRSVDTEEPGACKRKSPPEGRARTSQSAIQVISA